MRNQHQNTAGSAGRLQISAHSWAVQFVENPRVGASPEAEIWLIMLQYLYISQFFVCFLSVLTVLRPPSL